MSRTEAQLLWGDCSRPKLNHNTVFVTFARAQPVRFFQGGYANVVRVRAFGADWDERVGREQLYFAVRAFPKPPPPPGFHRKPYRGPEMYGEFGIPGDPLDLA